VKLVLFAWSDESRLEGRHEIRTDSLGWAAVDTIAARPWSVGAYVDSGRRSLVRIQVEPGRVTEVRIELPEGVEVRGEVRDVVRGLLPDLKIEFARESDGYHDGYWGQTDSRGRYRLAGVVPGLYVVTLTGGPFGHASRRRYWIEVPAASPVVTRDLRVGVRSLTGKVVDEETLEPVLDARVRLEPLFRTKRPRNLSLAADSNGLFDFIDLPAGEYRMRVSSDGYATHTTPSVEIDDAGAGESIEIKLQPAATLNLLVVDQAGNPVEGEMSLSLSRVGSSSGSGSRIRTDSEGRATYRRATAGTYRISVFKDGFGRASVRTELRRGENSLRLVFPP
jgi:hypothetical protein